jgi:hypothetical protein
MSFANRVRWGMHKKTLLSGIIDSSGIIAALQEILHNIPSDFTLLHPPILHSSVILASK